MGGGGALFMRPLIYSEVYLPATKSNVDGFFSPKEKLLLKKWARWKTQIRRKKGKNKKQMRKIVTTFPRQSYYHWALSGGETYGVESKLMLLACVDDADLWLEEKTGRLGEAWITWSTRWPTDDGRSRVPSCTNSEFLTNTKTHSVKGLGIQPHYAFGIDQNVSVALVIKHGRTQKQASSACLELYS